MKTLPDNMTIGEAYGPAMLITDQQEANEYFEALVQSNMRTGNSREKAESIERQNLGYYAGYYDSTTRERVESLFKCSHPFLTKTTTHEEAFEIGRKLASKQE